MMNQETDRIFVDTAMDDLLAAEARVRSLEQDIQTYRDMVQDLLTRLASQNAQVDRLMWRIRNER